MAAMTEGLALICVLATWTVITAGTADSAAWTQSATIPIKMTRKSETGRRIIIVFMAYHLGHKTPL
ncbi:MAG TPA: hypothetical protein DIT55_03190 [Spirochaetaceae bacterium]|nr:hypothetical protein [Spirochaetaceae bacterium]